MPTSHATADDDEEHHSQKLRCRRFKVDLQRGDRVVWQLDDWRAFNKSDMSDTPNKAAG